MYFDVFELGELKDSEAFCNFPVKKVIFAIETWFIK